jgi:4-alpha-glucanotransferase
LNFSLNMMKTPVDQLAGYYGINTGYIDMDGVWQPAGRDSLLAVFKAMGAPLNGWEDIPGAIRLVRQGIWHQPLEPVLVVWNDGILNLDLHLPEKLVGQILTASLVLENGDGQNFSWLAAESAVIETAVIENANYVTLRLLLPEKLPPGYHHLKIDYPGQTVECLIISSPVGAHRPSGNHKNIWGLFLPLYSLHTRRSWGAGDFGDLETLTDWVRDLGGNMIGTLPLLPSFFDAQIGPGPYMPASRLFWNEFYLDISRIPELADCPEAREIINSPGFEKSISSLRASKYVDYQKQLSLKRRVLELLSDRFFSAGTARYLQYQHYVSSHNRFEDYARFRAAGESRGIGWPDWPGEMKNGRLGESDYLEKNKQYHLYTQWLADEQMSHLFQKAREDNIYLYLDVPVGVHPFSYDVWRERDSFVEGVNGGAPPDPVFTGGQNWSFPPLHPSRIRHNGYRYVIDSLRHQLVQGGILRIDHMMNFHRLFWIPEGMNCRDGVYVNYKAEELYAILALESNRSRSILIGEDLGMVPPEVRPMMEKHGIYRMYVGQFEMISENKIGEIPSQSVASLNTHDMFPFASFWQETDISQRLKMNLIDQSRALKEKEQRRAIKYAILNVLKYKESDQKPALDAAAILKAVLDLLASSPAFGLLVNLEDLWMETRPQNVPGTQRKQNWTRKSRYSWEKFSRLPRVIELLHHLDEERKKSF